jgi:hypothetical protein
MAKEMEMLKERSDAGMYAILTIIISSVLYWPSSMITAFFGLFILIILSTLPVCLSGGCLGSS